jgi:hypothetical protein
MRVSLLLMRDLAWMALLLLSVGMAVFALAITQKRGEKTRSGR